MEYSEQPFWFMLLRNWKESRRRTGLTFPYLVGALRDSQASVTVCLEQAEGELFALLGAMCEDTPSTHVVRIGRCTVLKEPVAGVYAVNEGRGPDSPIESSGARGCHLFAESAYLERAADLSLASIYDNLRKRLAREIMAGNFSFSQRFGYGSYSPDELTFIRNTKAKAEARKAESSNAAK